MIESYATGKAGGMIFPLKADTVQPPKGGNNSSRFKRKI